LSMLADYEGSIDDLDFDEWKGKGLEIGLTKKWSHK
jgi:hypothetical protein